MFSAKAAGKHNDLQCISLALSNVNMDLYISPVCLAVMGVQWTLI